MGPQRFLCAGLSHRVAWETCRSKLRSLNPAPHNPEPLDAKRNLKPYPPDRQPRFLPFGESSLEILEGLGPLLFTLIIGGMTLGRGTSGLWVPAV